MDEKRSWRSSVGILQNGQSWNSLDKQFTPTPPSGSMVNAAITAFVGMVFFVISFTSPYWLQSYSYTYSDFSNAGLWEVCFDGFRYPKYQLDKKFTGCNLIYSLEYRIILEWLLPAWFAAVQTFMTVAFIASVGSLVTLSFVLVRWPMQPVLRYEWRLTGFASVCEAITVVGIFFAVLIFGTMCWSRSWLLNPNFNYLSWSYAFAVVAGGIHLLAALILLHETYESRERKREAQQMMHMEGPGEVNMGHISGGYI